MEQMNIIDIIERLKIGLTSRATGGSFDNQEYKQLRKLVVDFPPIQSIVPRFLKICKTIDEFWEFIKGEFSTYAERRHFLSESFNEIIDFLELALKEESPIFNKDSYGLGDIIGKGGYGIVYKYHHELLGCDFAIKIFEPLFVLKEENQKAEKRFYREAKMLFELNHDNIVKIYDIGKIEGKPFIRMELIEDGMNMNEFVTKYSTVTYERSKKPIIALLKGLQYAHNKGIIHRDLKPSNFMVDRHGKFKIIDFGISAFLESDGHTQLTQIGEHVAGGLYTDPILMENPKLKDFRSDIYSVGAIWYFLLTGTAPSGSDISNKLIRSSGINTLQANTILKCLAHDIEDRYENCDELLNILEPISLSNNRRITNSTENITQITREDISEYLVDLYIEQTQNFNVAPFQQRDPREIFYYCGRKSEVEFLKRLFPLSEMPSNDNRCKNFEEEIIMHTIKNNDFDIYWIFEDERLGLKNGNDNSYLKFLAEMFHPEVRQERSCWNKVLDKINDFIEVDGYEIFASSQISRRNVFSYRIKI